MKKRVCFLFFTLFFIVNIILGIEIKLIEKIPLSQEKAILLYASPFAVTKDEVFIVPDMRAGDIKLYNNNGKLIKIWGRKGPGPDEFYIPTHCDYQEPYFALMDYQKRKIFVYQRIEKIKFKKTNEILCMALGSDIQLIKNQVLVSGYIANSKGEAFDLYIKDLKNLKTHFLLSSELKYGFKSSKKFNKEYREKDDIVSIGISGYCASEGDCVYFVWEGKLRIIKINLKTSEIDYFGNKTSHYTEPWATKLLIKSYNEGKIELYGKEKRRMSYITGIFADKNFVGLIYGNFDKVASHWQMILQLYSPRGKFLKESILPGAVTYDDYLLRSFFYSKEKDTLYYLSRKINKDFNDVLEILKYEIIN